MSAIALNRNYELQLPNSYVDVDRDEMEYVDGGSAFTDWFFSVNNIGNILNTVISLAIPAGGIAAYISRVGTRTAARYLEGAIVNKLKCIGLAAAAAAAPGIIGYVLNSLNVGLKLAQALDSIDHCRNNGIVW